VPPRGRARPSAIGPLAHAAFPTAPDPITALLPPLPAAEAESLPPVSPAPARSGQPVAVETRPRSTTARIRGSARPDEPVAALGNRAVPAPRARSTVRAEIDGELLEQARRVVYWEPGVTLTDLIARGLELIVRSYLDERGNPYPQRPGPLRTGRPIRTKP